MIDRPVVVITGASSGIGAETALAYAAKGYAVVLAARREDKLQVVAERCRTQVGEDLSLIVTTDVTQRDQVEALAAATMERFGRIDAWSNNAGYGQFGRVHELDEQDVRDIFEVNFFASQALLGEAARRMVGAKSGGHLLACASCVSKFSPPYHGAYAATKAAQDLYCQAIRLELAPAGIHVSTIHPITTTTDFFDVSADVSGRPGGSSGIDHTPRMFRQSADRVAAAILRCLRKPVPEVWTSRVVRLTAALRTLRPSIVDRQMRGMLDHDRLTGEDRPSSE